MWIANGDRYEAVDYRRAGDSGIVLPPLSLGLWHNFGSGRDFETQRGIIQRAFDLGITHFDLANNYGPPPGSAERVFGAVLDAGLGLYRDELFIATKAGYEMWEGPYGSGGSRKHLLASLTQSLARMNLDHVDVFYLHRFDPYSPVDETVSALVEAVESGKARYIGLSNHSLQQTNAVLERLAGTGVRVLLQQERYSMLNREIEGDLLPGLRSQGVGVVIFSPLAQGLLTNRYLSGGIPADSRAATSRFLTRSDVTDEYRRKAQALAELAAKRGQSLSRLALQWALRHDVITSAVVGASSVEQLEENWAATQDPQLQPDEIQELEALLA